jgi:outer membrane receptor for ferrienterochelin and colicins
MSTNRIIQSALSLSIITVMMGTAYAAESPENSKKPIHSLQSQPN